LDKPILKRLHRHHRPNQFALLLHRRQQRLQKQGKPQKFVLFAKMCMCIEGLNRQVLESGLEQDCIARPTMQVFG
jgi:hypothetical protein